MMYQCQIWADQAQALWLAADLKDFTMLLLTICMIGWRVSTNTKRA